MNEWDRLRAEIIRLRDDRPSPLSGYPDPASDDPPRPVQIRLAPWATDDAAILHRRFGDDVNLTVGAMSYPVPVDQPVHEPPAQDMPPELTCAPAEPLTIRSGHSQTASLLVTNHGDAEITVLTNGHLTAVVTDPATSQAVGTHAGPVPLPMITFRIRPGTTVPIPLLVGTASRVAALGHAVPAGQWTVHATLGLRDGRAVRTAPFPITIT